MKDQVDVLAIMDVRGLDLEEVGGMVDQQQVVVYFGLDGGCGEQFL